MEKFRKLFAGILCLSIGAFTLVSCNDDDPVPLQAVVDVMIQDLKTDAGIRYGLVIYATSNYEMKSVKVTGPGTTGEVYDLTATADKRQFAFEMETGDYTAALPVKGDYSFEITSVNDEKLTVKDVVGDEKLAPIVIKTATLASQKLKTTWDKVTGAEAYIVYLRSADKSQVLFSSSYLADDKVEFEFGATASGWASGKSPVAGTDYVLELRAIKAETGVIYDKGSNLQFVTLDSKTIKWE
ncbi:MAG: hypothetical protein K0M40_06255 [Prolixibacteraceae bacterium]|nr:hypothetical protein [Prolixibacteraceae bacterium]